MKVDKMEINTDMQTILDRLISEVQDHHLGFFEAGYRNLEDFLMVQCPYHKEGREHTPSAIFSKEDGHLWCFSCEETHSLPEVISYILSNNGTKIDGRAWLRNNFDTDAVAIPKFELSIGKKNQKPKPKQMFIDESILEEYNFKHPYMYKRKLTDDVIEKFHIGYDKDFTITTVRGDQKFTRNIGECITFPVRDELGRICFIARRSIHSKIFHYPEGVEKPVYGLYEIMQEKKRGAKIGRVYVCESMLDALTIWAYGGYAVALNGTGSSKQYDILRKSDIPLFVLATDNDSAGRIARKNFRKNVKGKFIKEISYESYGSCKDVNDFTKEQFDNAKVI